MTTLVDPIERRDPWGALWRFLTSDAALAAVCALVLIGALAAFVLPQTPSSGTADPVSYSRWEAEAKLREGALYDPLSGLGLNSVAQTAWWRTALVGVAALAALRLVERVARLLAARAPTDALRAEVRVRVMLDAPDLGDMAHRLRSQRYRVVQPNGETLVADRAPVAEGLSILGHVGVLLAAAGVLMNVALGWGVVNRSIAAGATTGLHSEASLTLNDASADTVRLTLQPGDTAVALTQGQGLSANGIAFGLRQITPGYRLSAVTANGQPVLIRASNFVSPTTEVLLAFGEGEPERYVAVPGAGVALALAVGDAGQPERLRVFAIPSGAVITETALAPQVQVNGVTFQFQPARGAVIDATYQPGNPVLWAGLVLALVGLAGGLLRPMQRILIRHHGHWTEFYASGRGVRRVIDSL